MFLLFAILLGAAYSALLYWFRKDAYNQAGISPKARWLLSALRFINVSLIAYLLIGPLVKREVHQEEKPIIVLAHDNSRSLNYCKDSTFYADSLPESLELLVSKLEKSFRVERWSYDAQPSRVEAFDGVSDGASTNIGATLSQLADQYVGQNLGAIILTSDGIYNSGPNPIPVAESAAIPLFTVALGDTVPQRDVAIIDLKANSVVYKGNSFALQIQLRATHLKGLSSRLVVTSSGKTLFQKQVAFQEEDQILSEEVVLDAKEVGLQHYEIALAPCPNERSLRNNRRTITVQVVDGSEKIAIIAAAPHPDIAALKRSIETNQNYEVETFLASQLKGMNDPHLNGCSLIIFHNLPSKVAPFSNQQTNKPANQQIPSIYILGAQTDLAAFNSLKLGLTVSTRLAKQTEVTARYNASFASFSLDQGTIDQIEQFPPLKAPFGNYESSPNLQSLFTAQIGNVGSGQPLVACLQDGARRVAIVVGEGLWKWRLYDYQANQSYDHFDELIAKTIQYTSLRVDRDRWSARSQSSFAPGEPVQIFARLYDDNYQLTNAPDAELSISQDKSSTQQFNNSTTQQLYSFNRSGNEYALNLGTLPAGKYHFIAKTTFNRQDLTSEGNFAVEDFDPEAAVLTANHSLLNTLATTTGGVMVSPRELDQLPQLLQQQPNIKTVRYSHTQYVELLNLPLLLVLLLLLLAAEWMLRRYFGEV